MNPPLRRLSLNVLSLAMRTLLQYDSCHAYSLYANKLRNDEAIQWNHGVTERKRGGVGWVLESRQHVLQTIFSAHCTVVRFYSGLSLSNLHEQIGIPFWELTPRYFRNVSLTIHGLLFPKDFGAMGMVCGQPVLI